MKYMEKYNAPTTKLEASRKTHRKNGSMKQCQKQNFAIAEAQKHYKNADSDVQHTTGVSQAGNVDRPPRHPRCSRNQQAINTNITYNRSPSWIQGLVDCTA